MNSPKQLTRIGIFYLEEAILDVLSEARHQGRDFISKADIEREVGIYQRWENSQFLCASILNKLEGDARIKTRQSETGRTRTGWQIEETEYNQRIGAEPPVQPLPSGPLIVIMPNGEKIAETRGIDTFVKVIEKIGVGKVKALGITAVQRRRLPLIADYEDAIHTQRPSGRYYIASGNSTLQKKRWLDEIASRLQLKIQVIAAHRVRSNQS